MGIHLQIAVICIIFMMEALYMSSINCSLNPGFAIEMGTKMKICFFGAALFLTLLPCEQLFSTDKKSAPQPKKDAAKISQGAQSKQPSLKRENSLTLNKGFLKPEPVITKYNRPEDLLDLIPFIRDINRLIPRRFSLANHQFQLATNEMVINHRFDDIKSRITQKNSIITFSYFGGLGGEFDTRLDVPLFYSSVLGLANWYRYPVGNYTMTLTRAGPQENESRLYIGAVTRFDSDLTFLLRDYGYFLHAMFSQLRKIYLPRNNGKEMKATE